MSNLKFVQSFVDKTHLESVNFTILIHFVFQGFTGLGKEEEESAEPIRLGKAARAAHVVGDAGAPVQLDVGTIFFPNMFQRNRETLTFESFD